MSNVPPGTSVAKTCINCGSPNVSQKQWVLRNDFRLGVCDACGFKFAQPRPSLNYLIDYYNSIANSRFYRHTNEQALGSIIDILRLIKKFHPQAKSVLEIGCSTAYYLQGLKLKGYDVIGSELSLDAVNLAEEWYKIKVYNAEFPPEDQWNSFDVIIIHHVIEHVIEPRDFLKRAEKFLKRDGIMILETPNFRSAGIGVFKSHYPVLCPPGHLNFFELKTLSDIIPANHKIVHAKTTSEGLTVYNSVVAFTSVLGMKNALNDVVSKKVKVKDSTVAKLDTNRKFAYGKILSMFSKISHVILYPIFAMLDNGKRGENLSIVSKKVG